MSTITLKKYKMKEELNSLINETLNKTIEIADKNFDDSDTASKVIFVMNVGLNLLGNLAMKLVDKDNGLNGFREMANITLETLEEWFDNYIKEKMN